jgi:AAA15 family ATPase/GTPase
MLEKVDINVELEDGIKLDFKDMEFRNLNIFVGANGIGKSFIFKYLWYASYAMQTYKLSLLMVSENFEEEFQKNAEKLFGYVFEDGEEISGSISLTDEKETIYNFMIEIDKGKLTSFDLTVHDPEKFKMGEIQSVKYASKDTRTFEAVERYTKTKELMNLPQITSEDDLDKLCQIYKIYDLFFLEDILRKLYRWTENPDTFEEDLIPGIGNRLNDLIVSDDLSTMKAVILENGKPKILFEDGRTKRLSSMSSGSQSIMMLTLFAR